MSIVTPSLNQGRFIEAALQSVRAQDYPRIEHLVLDGGSSDDTLAILGCQGNRIRWVSKPDRGQTNALNHGFRMASGDIVSWLNADDVLLPGAVRVVVEAFQANPDVAMVYGNGELMDVAGRPLSSFRFTEPFDLDRLIEVSAFILQPAAFVRRDSLASVGYLDERLNWCMDWDLWIRIGQRYRVGFLRHTLARVRLHPESKTSRGGLPKIREMHEVIRRHSRRRLPPILVIHAAGLLYRALCRRCGITPDNDASRPLSQVGWIKRRLDHVLDRGQLPWEWRARPHLRRRPPTNSEAREALETALIVTSPPQSRDPSPRSRSERGAQERQHEPDPAAPVRAKS